MEKTIVFDIETFAMIGSTWNFYEGTLNEIIRRPILACFSFKELGNDKVYSYSLPDFPRYKTSKIDDAPLTRKMWEILNSYDKVIAHNGKLFDLKMANYFFIIHHLKPPKTYPYVIIDTKNEFKKVARFPNNKLDYISSLTGHGHKMETGGYSLWQKCEKGDMKSWRAMIAYNKMDVLKLEEVYLEIVPWIVNHPSITKEHPLCPHCDSSKVNSRGISALRGGNRQIWRCKNCGRTFRGKLIKRNDTKTISKKTKRG